MGSHGWGRGSALPTLSSYLLQRNLFVPPRLRWCLRNSQLLRSSGRRFVLYLFVQLGQPHSSARWFLYVTTMEINSILPPTFVLCALPWDGAAVVGGGLQLWDGHGDPQTAQNPRAQRGWGCGDADTEGCARISAWQWGGDAWGAGCDPGAVSSPRPAVLRGQTVLRKHRSCALRPGSSSGSGGGGGDGGGGGAAPSPLRRPRAVAARRFPSLSAPPPGAVRPAAAGDAPGAAHTALELQRGAKGAGQPRGRAEGARRGRESPPRSSPAAPLCHAAAASPWAAPASPYAAAPAATRPSRARIL